MKIRSLESLSKDELIEIILRERKEAEAIGAGGVSLMGGSVIAAKDAEINQLTNEIERLNKELVRHLNDKNALIRKSGRESGAIPHNESAPISDEFLSQFYYEDGRIRRKSDDSLADTYKLNSGYAWVRHQRGGFRESHVAHRVAWALRYGEIPRGMEIDHIDRNKANNRLENLRLVTRGMNEHNKPAKGTTYRRDCNRWQAQIRTPEGRKHLGLYKTMEEARAAYLAEKAKIDPMSAALTQQEQTNGRDPV